MWQFVKDITEAFFISLTGVLFALVTAVAICLPVAGVWYGVSWLIHFASKTPSIFEAVSPEIRIGSSCFRVSDSKRLAMLTAVPRGPYLRRLREPALPTDAMPV